MFCTEGVRTTACSHILDNFVPTYEFDGHGASVARRRGAARQDQLRRVRHGLVERDLVFQAGDLAVAAQGGQHAAGAGRLIAAARRRRWPRICAWAPPAPTPAAPSGNRRPSPARSASSRPTAAARAGASSPLPPRSTRPARSRARVRDAAILLRSMAGNDPKDTTCADLAGARLRSRGRPIGEGPAHRHPERIPARRHAGRDRDDLGAGQDMAEGGRRRTRRRVAAAHQIRAARLLHRRAGRGLVQSRPLRRRALRLARSAAAISPTCTRRRAAPASAPRCAGAC